MSSADYFLIVGLLFKSYPCTAQLTVEPQCIYLCTRIRKQISQCTPKFSDGLLAAYCSVFWVTTSTFYASDLRFYEWKFSIKFYKYPSNESRVRKNADLVSPPSTMYVTVSKPRWGWSGAPTASPGPYTVGPMWSSIRNGSHSLIWPPMGLLTTNPPPSLCWWADVKRATPRSCVEGIFTDWLIFFELTLLGDDRRPKATDLTSDTSTIGLI